MSKSIPYKVRSAASSFRKHRADYYKYLANMLEASKGNTKLSTLFDRDAQRYAGEPKGVLCEYWHDQYMNNGGNLSEAWDHTLPDDEVTIIRVAQDAGAGALVSALKDISRIATLSDRIKSEVKTTLSAAVFGIVLALVMTTIFPMFSAGKLQEIYSFIPLDQWGAKGKAFNAHADRVREYGLYFVYAFIFVIVGLNWTINNLTGKSRDWLDQNVALYKSIRDIKGALFLSTMSTLTRRRGNVMFTLRESLASFADSARSPWLKWRVEQIVDGIDRTGAIGTEAFNTPLLSREMYFYLRDTQEALGFAEGFIETGAYVESSIVDGISKKLAVYRWILLLVGVFCVIGVMGWQMSIIHEMKDVMQIFYSSK